jgi:hypothetical protein
MKTLEKHVLYNLEMDKFLFKRIKMGNPFKNYYIWHEWDGKALRYEDDADDMDRVRKIALVSSSESFLKSLYLKDTGFFDKDHKEVIVVVPIQYRYSTCDSESIVIDYIRFDKAERLV